MRSNCRSGPVQSPESAVKSFRNLQTAASTLWPADGRLAAPQSNISRTTAERGLLVHVTAFPAGTGVLGFGILTLGTVEEVTGTGTALPFAIEALLAPYRRIRL